MKKKDKKNNYEKIENLYRFMEVYHDSVIDLMLLQMQNILVGRVAAEFYVLIRLGNFKAAKDLLDRLGKERQK